MIRVSDLEVRFGDVDAVSKISFEIPDHGTLALVGAAQAAPRGNEALGVKLARALRAPGVSRSAAVAIELSDSNGVPVRVSTGDPTSLRLLQASPRSAAHVLQSGPVVLPGEFMKVFILKEGKEYNQGVAYLDDGTMVVVDNARRLISRNIDVVVTSVLQTTAGKMIFGRYIENAAASSAPAPAAPPASAPAAAASSAVPAGRAQPNAK